MERCKKFAQRKLKNSQKQKILRNMLNALICFLRRNYSFMKCNLKMNELSMGPFTCYVTRYRGEGGLRFVTVQTKKISLWKICDKRGRRSKKFLVTRYVISERPLRSRRICRAECGYRNSKKTIFKLKRKRITP